MPERDKKTVEDGTTDVAADAQAAQAAPPGQAEATEDEIEARALLDSFDGRITEIERRIDRVLARLDAG